MVAVKKNNNKTLWWFDLDKTILKCKYHNLKTEHGAIAEIQFCQEMKKHLKLRSRRLINRSQDN